MPELFVGPKRGNTFTFSEDKLLEMGVSLFLSKISEDHAPRGKKRKREEDELPGSWKSIQYRFLPAKTSQQIRARYRTLIRRKTLGKIIVEDHVDVVSNSPFQFFFVDTPA